MKHPIQYALECHHLSISFGSIDAIRDVSMQVRQGEILALIGPSGCGKTTLLRLIAGFECPHTGEILLQGKSVFSHANFVPPEKRGVGMVFQDYALFPHLNIGANIAFGLNQLSKTQRSERIQEMLEMVGLTGYEQRLPHELSGGERQRVALARALAPKPVVLLMDEPFSNLDADRRAQMRYEVRQIVKKSGITCIFVTHDQEEALFMGDRLAILNRGALEQVGTPEQVFQQPPTRFIAEFMGETDFIRGFVTPSGIQTEIGHLIQTVNYPPGSQVEVAVRADDVTFSIDQQGSAQIFDKIYRGAINLYAIRLSSGEIVHSMQAHTFNITPGVRVDARIEPGHSLAHFLVQNQSAPETLNT